MTQNGTQALEAAYREHRGLLFGALARLAAQGYAADPADALDLMHDFFIEAWPGLNERFDPARASFTTYMYAAFVRFARPRIARLIRQRGLLFDPAKLEGLAGTISLQAEPEYDHAIDTRRLTAVIARLPEDRRVLLERWLNAAGSSERQAAHELGISRYELRQRLIEVLGQLTSELDGLPGSDDDRKVALAMWRDGATVREAAAKLGLTRQQIRNATQRNQRVIQRCISLMHALPSTHSKEQTMSSTAAMQHLASRIANEEISEELVSEIEREAAGLVDYLTSTYPADQNPWQSIPEAKLARVYGAIARGMGSGGEEHAEIAHVDDELFKAYADDRDAVDRAFVEALVPALPPFSLALLGQLLTEHEAVVEPVVPNRDSPPPIQTLGLLGLTPSDIVLASDGIGMYIERAVDAQHFNDATSLIFECADGRVEDLIALEGPDHLDRVHLVNEIELMTNKDTGTSEALLDWLVDIAPHVYALFGEFTADLDSRGTVLTRLAPTEEPRDLYERWRPTLQAIELPEIVVLDAEEHDAVAAQLSVQVRQYQESGE